MAAEKNTPTSGQSGLTPKQLAEQARAESEAAERRRERTIRIVGGLVVLLVVGRPAGRRVPRRSGRRHRQLGRPRPRRRTRTPPCPPGSSGDNYGVPYGTGWTSADEAKLPDARDLGGLPVPGLRAGRGGLRRRRSRRWPTRARSSCSTGRPPSSTSAWPRTTQANGNPNSSARATSAWGCAIDAGQGRRVPLGRLRHPARRRGRRLLRPAADRPRDDGRDRRRGPGHLHQVRPGRHLPARGRPTATRRSSRPASAAPRPPTSTASSSTGPTWPTSRASRRRSTPRPPSDRRAGHLDPQPGPVGLAPGPAAAAGVRAVHPGGDLRRHVGRRPALGRPRRQPGPRLRRGRLGGAVRDHRRAALPRRSPTGRPTSAPGGSGLRGAIAIWEGGLGIWGAIALGTVGAWIGCRRQGVPLPPFADAAGRGRPAGPGHRAARATGSTRSSSASPRTCRGAWRSTRCTGPTGYEQFATFHPTFLYEALWLVGVAGLVAWADRRWTLGHGRAFALYVAAYCVGRLGMELLRIDPATQVGGIRINVFTSVVVGRGGGRLLRGQRPDATRARGPGCPPGYRGRSGAGSRSRSEGTLSPGEVRTFGARLLAVQSTSSGFRVPHS